MERNTTQHNSSHFSFLKVMSRSPFQIPNVQQGKKRKRPRWKWEAYGNETDDETGTGLKSLPLVWCESDLESGNFQTPGKRQSEQRSQGKYVGVRIGIVTTLESLLLSTFLQSAYLQYFIFSQTERREGKLTSTLNVGFRLWKFVGNWVSVMDGTSFHYPSL